ncbi:hypothetical protein PMAYCL1PPCAC_17991, partial [Pristionchus mayeri]
VKLHLLQKKRNARIAGLTSCGLAEHARRLREERTMKNELKGGDEKEEEREDEEMKDEEENEDGGDEEVTTMKSVCAMGSLFTFSLSPDVWSSRPPFEEGEEEEEEMTWLTSPCWDLALDDSRSIRSKTMFTPSSSSKTSSDDGEEESVEQPQQEEEVAVPRRERRSERIQKAIEERKEVEWKTPTKQKVIKCDLCAFSSLSASSFIDHLSITHHTTLLKEGHLLRCRCGLYVKDEEGVREHSQFSSLSLSPIDDRETPLQCNGSIYEKVKIIMKHASILIERGEKEEKEGGRWRGYCSGIREASG